MKTIVVIVGLIVGLVAGGDPNTSCEVDVEVNPMNYTCGAQGHEIETPDSVCATTFGCGSGDIEAGGTNSTELNWQVTCEDVGEGYVIKCIPFAAYGSVAGSCGEVEGSGECFFDVDHAVFLPDYIGLDCIGQSFCNITVTYDGFLYDNVEYDLRHEQGLGQVTTLASINLPLKFKMIVVCGPPDQDVANITFDDCSDATTTPTTPTTSTTSTTSTTATTTATTTTTSSETTGAVTTSAVSTTESTTTTEGGEVTLIATFELQTTKRGTGNCEVVVEWVESTFSVSDTDCEENEETRRVCLNLWQTKQGPVVAKQTKTTTFQQQKIQL